MDDDLTHHSRVEALPDRMGMRTRVLATLFVIGAIAFWIFAFSPQARDMFVAPDGIEDEQLISQIIDRCQAALDDLDGIPPARTAETPGDRAVIVTDGTGILRSMVGDIGSFSDGSDDDHRLLNLWLADWDVYLGDRDRHVTRLLDEGDVRFLTTEENGVFINERMNGFSRRNELDVCQTPGDL
ncbi:MAG: hypothetical protein ACR2P0_07060 [Acidimicrobiales bacterium]